MIVAGHAADTAGAAFREAFSGYEIEILQDADLDGISEQIKSGDAECAFVIDSLDSYTYYVDNLSMYDMNTSTADEVLTSVYRLSAMVENGLSPEQAAGIMSAQIVHETVSLGKDQMQNFFYTYIMVLCALYGYYDIRADGGHQCGDREELTRNGAAHNKRKADEYDVWENTGKLYCGACSVGGCFRLGACLL